MYTEERENFPLFYAKNETFPGNVRIIYCNQNNRQMKTYKSKFPEITLKLKRGEILNCQIKNSKDCADLFRSIWDVDTLPICESVIVIFLNRNNNTIGWLKVSQGGLSGTVVDVRLVLATALGCLASGIILCHNHPSGNLNPSQNDSRMTEKLKKSAEIMDISVLDHIILTEEGYYSFMDNDIL